MSDVGIGIIGSRFLAETRARCYAQINGARIVAVASRTEESAREYGERHGIDRTFTDYHELLARPEVQAVDLCVPNLLHREMAEAAAAAGKHVLCTKPLTAYVGQDLPDDASDADVSNQPPDRMLEIAVADAEAMVAAAHDAGVHLAYGENWVHAPPYDRALDLVTRSGGAILEMRGHESHNGSHSPYSKLWRYTGGGALLRLGAHPIGAMLHLKAAEGIARDGRPIRPVSVTADVADLTKRTALTEANTRIATGWVDVENWGCVVITFEDGSRGTAWGSDNMVGGMESRLEIHASNCHVKCNLSPHDLVRAYASDEEVFGDAYIMEKVDTRAGWSTPLPNEDWSSGHVALCRDFVESVRDGRPPRATGELGLEVTKVVYAAYVAAASGTRVDL